MQKIAIGVLSLLTLALAAMNARHQDRERILEERLAAAEKKLKRKPEAVAPIAPEPPPIAEVPAPAPVAVPEQIPTPVTPAAQDKRVLAEKMNPFLSGSEVVYTSFALTPDSGAFKASFALTSPDEKLTLTDAQRTAIDRLREVQTRQSQEVEQAIRNLMTPEQLKKYDGRNVAQTLWVGQVGHTGIKPGYLGVSGGDASGGGAEVTNVLPNTAASSVGLQNGDVILEVNGEPIPGLSALSETIRKTGEGFATTLRIRRAGVEFIQGVQLGGASK